MHRALADAAAHLQHNKRQKKEGSHFLLFLTFTPHLPPENPRLIKKCPIIFNRIWRSLPRFLESKINRFSLFFVKDKIVKLATLIKQRKSGCTRNINS